VLFLVDFWACFEKHFQLSLDCPAYHIGMGIHIVGITLLLVHSSPLGKQRMREIGSVFYTPYIEPDKEVVGAHKVADS